MEKVKTTSVAQIALKVTNFFWYLFVLILGIVPVLLILGYLKKLPFWLNFDISLPVNTDIVTVSSDLDNTLYSIDSAEVSLNISNFAQLFPNLFIEHSLGLIVAIIIVLGILYQLKKLLASTVNQQVFKRQNIRRIKILAILVFIIDPLSWLFHNIISEPLFADASTHITISLPPSLGYWFVGLLIFALAAIFEKGHEMYQELKLTV